MRDSRFYVIVAAYGLALLLAVTVYKEHKKESARRVYVDMAIEEMTSRTVAIEKLLNLHGYYLHEVE